MIEVKVENGDGKCKMGGNMLVLLVEAITAVRSIYEGFSKDPEAQELFLMALHDDAFLEGMEVQINRDDSYVIENDAEDFLRKFMDALRR